MNLGKQIKALRQRRGLTQEALARELGVSGQTVSKWETGTTLPDIAMLPQLSVFFGVTVDELLAISPETQMARMESHLEDAALLSGAEAEQMEKTLLSFAEKRENAGKSYSVLCKLHNHQAEAYREIATRYGKQAAEMTHGDADAVAELANAMGSYVPDWNVRNHHELIAYLQNFMQKNPQNRSACMWLLDNLIADRRLTEASKWLAHLASIDDTFRTPLYRYLLAEAAWDREGRDKWLAALEAWPEEWCLSLALGDIYVSQERYADAIKSYQKAQALQPSPKFIDAAVSVARVYEIQKNAKGAVEAYGEALRLLKEEWGIVSGAQVERLQALQEKNRAFEK